MFRFHVNNLKSSYNLRLAGSLEISKLVLFVSSLCDGMSNIKNISNHKDIDVLIDVLKNFSLDISKNSISAVVNGKNIEFWQQPHNVLEILPEYDIVNYLISIISVKNFRTFITSSMDFIKDNVMDFDYLDNNDFIFRDRNKHLPVLINGNYSLQKTSIKVKNTVEKNALLFNFLSNQTKKLILDEYGVESEYLERILNFYRLNIKENQFESRNFLTGERIRCKEIYLTNTNKDEIVGKDFIVPVDIKEAIYTIFIALILDIEEINIEGVSIDEFNSDIINVLIENGVNIELKNQKILNGIKIADILVKRSVLKPISISRDRFLKILDFYPIVIILNAIRKNTVLIYGIKEVANSEENNYKFLMNFFERINTLITEDKKSVELDFTGVLLNNVSEIKITKEHNIDEKTTLAMYLSNIYLNKDLEITNDFDILDIFPNIVNVFQIFDIECSEKIQQTTPSI